MIPLRTNVPPLRPSGLLCASAFSVICLLLQPCLAATNEPQPIVVTTGDFLGYDGAWSTFNIDIGTPAQYIAVLPHTTLSEIWAIGQAGCDGTTLCAAKRGGLFYSNESTTFQAQGNFQINAADGTYGYYGLDNVYLDDGTTIPDSIISVVNSTESWIGYLGLGVKGSRFAGNTDYKSVISSLVENGSTIPSHSYGYTAGAHYRLKTVPASLTLGGVDANRYTPNDITFTLNPDYAPVLALNSISVSSTPSNGDAIPSNWISNPTTLLDTSQAGLYTIDSSTPFLWMPEDVCDNFASALNLTYDESLQLYLYDNTTSPNILRAWNLSFTFALGNAAGSTENIELDIPYDAFNLQLSYPFPSLDAEYTSLPTNYFPLRKAANSARNIIGRAFLQETYLIVDYERNNFSVSQAVFTEAAIGDVNLLSISRPDNSTWPGPQIFSAKRGLSTGVKAGIGIGAAIGALLVLALLWFCYRRRRSSSDGESDQKAKAKSIFSKLRQSPNPVASVSELVGDKRQPTEVPADTSASRFELSGNVPVEMAAAEVSSTFLENPSASSDGALPRNDPRSPAELEHRNSTSKDGIIGMGSERSSSPVPPYSPPDANNSVSPYTTSGHGHGFGAGSSGEQSISPVDGGNTRHSTQSSNGKPSPVSPEDTMVRRIHGHSPPISNSNSSFSSGSGGLLIPQLHGRPPSRSPSTGSRFHEEGLSTVAEERLPTPTARRSMQDRRFSWEQ